MPEIDKHAPGAFCWIELGTSDPQGAQGFYGALLGWSANEFPIGPGETYTMFERGGRGVGAAYRAHTGEPVAWSLYIAVTDAHAIATRVESLGGKLIKPPFDVADYGRMAVIADPTGAAFCIWEALNHKGLDVYGEEGTLCWADLSSTDIPAAQRFYTDLFGWRIFADARDPSGYLHIQNGDAVIGGIQTAEQRNPHAPPHWLAYFQTADCEASANHARELGAEIFLAPVEVPGVGHFAVLADPQGAVFALFQPPHAA